jgi:hypothetical protein
MGDGNCDSGDFFTDREGRQRPIMYSHTAPRREISETGFAVLKTLVAAFVKFIRATGDVAVPSRYWLMGVQLS